MLSALLLFVTQPPSIVADESIDCTYDLQAMLELDRSAFDQDLDGGWRTLGQQKGCEASAAELIREWRHEKRDHNPTLYWHEGQMRAFAGQTQQAIALFALTYQSIDEDADFGWNHYVDGTIAFLRGDKKSLDRAMSRLKAIPAPKDSGFVAPDGVRIKIAWPPDIDL